MKHTQFKYRLAGTAVFLALAALLPLGAQAQEGPPSVNGVIKDPTLERNSAVAKAQAVGAITTFMSKGAQECDADGRNCRSVFGADDTPDYTSMKFRGQAATGVESYSFQTDDNDSGSIATQMGTLALACGDTKTKTIAGIAFKALSCVVSTNGDVRLTMQVCTAPARGNPVVPPENGVQCSTDPSAPNFTAPYGKVCLRPACDTEPLNSLNGWSSPKDIVWNANMSPSAPEAERSNNGLGLVLYPNPAAGAALSFATDSDTMTAVKVIQSFRNSENGSTAVGLRIAYRHKTQLTKEMIADAGSISNPSAHTSQWDTLTKLQANPLIPQHQATFAKNGSECLQQIQEGVASDGIISVCDTGYSNEAGIRPLQLTAQVAAAGQECGSVPQCLQEVVNTNTWTEKCEVSAPLALRDCTTTQAYTMDKISYTRTRTTEICHERRLTAEYSCNTYAEPSECRLTNTVGQGGMEMVSLSADTKVEMVPGSNDGLSAKYLYGTIGDNYWGSGYYSRSFYIDIRDVSDVKKFLLYHVGFDDLMAVQVNGHWIWSDYKEGFFNPEYNSWGRWNEIRTCTFVWDQENNTCRECVRWGGGDEGRCEQFREDAWSVASRRWETQWELKRSWSYPVNVDFRPYLHEGRNIIRIDTGVVGGGEGWAYFEISSWKPVCNTVVRNECAQYENAR